MKMKMEELLKLNDEDLLNELLHECGYDGCAKGLFIPIIKGFDILVKASGDDVKKYMGDEDASTGDIFRFYCMHEEEINEHVFLENIADIRAQLKTFQDMDKSKIHYDDTREKEVKNIIKQVKQGGEKFGIHKDGKILLNADTENIQRVSNVDGKVSIYGEVIWSDHVIEDSDLFREWDVEKTLLRILEKGYELKEIDYDKLASGERSFIYDIEEKVHVVYTEPYYDGHRFIPVEKMMWVLEKERNI